jgi:hypothetical protein
MPVLEAMACGLPVITTAGGPTDEFCPPEAGWRIRARRLDMKREEFGELEPAGIPWMLEPDIEHLVELLRLAAADESERSSRGQAARRAAQLLPWDRAAQLYTERIVALSATTPRGGRLDPEPFPLEQDVALRVLATPAWRGLDRLSELLREWAEATTPQTSACLYLLADPATAGTTEQVEAHVVDAATRAELDLDGCADINILFEPFRHDRDERLHAAMDAYVPLHSGCAGQVRLAAASGAATLALGEGALTKRVATLSPA